MTVYVDDMYRQPMGQLGRMKMSHLIADSTEELREMARLIGVDPKWIQKPGTAREHFDIAMSRRAQAVLRGAVEVDMRTMVRMVRFRRENGRLPTEAEREELR